jgi:hypothetical protein
MVPNKASLTKNNGILDKLWRTIGKETARCEICQTLPPNERVHYNQLHPHHIIKRGHKATRWDLMNRIWVCPTHHTLGKVTVEFNEGGWFRSDGKCWLKEHKPDVYKYLKGKEYLVKQWSLDELLELYEFLKTRRDLQ